MELSTELVGLEQDSNGVIVHVVKRSPSGEIKETFRAPFVIGADGARSACLPALDLFFKFHALGLRCYPKNSRA